MVEISVLLPVYNEENNLTDLLPGLKKTLGVYVDSFEIIVIDAGSEDRSIKASIEHGAEVFTQKQEGFGNAIKEGFGACRGKYILTMDADNSHSPEFIQKLVEERNRADLVIGSRFIKGALFYTNAWRKILSLILNKTFKVVLSLPANDSSSGFRMYRKEVLKDIDIESKDFDIQLELLIKVIAGGWRIKEIPIRYKKRLYGDSKASVIKCGLAFLKTALKMYRLRNSILSCDYDERAYSSRLLPQRLWHKFKDKITFRFADNDKFTLDAGCGSGSFIQTSTKAVGLDIDIRKLRYLGFVKKLKKPLILGNASNLPFKNGVFEQIICSEVIEHIPKSDDIFKEFHRTLKDKGKLIVTTPNYGFFVWPALEWAYKKIIPEAYADKHISHYNPQELVKCLRNNGFKIIRCEFFLKAIIVIDTRKED